MIRGARTFLPRVARAYDDPRVRYFIEDARAFFARAGKRYDIIVSEPSNPWVSGVASLFTRIPRGAGARGGPGADCAQGGRSLQLLPWATRWEHETANFTHHFLIAMPAMADPHFSHTLTYVCEHSAEGALGIVVNKPTDMTLSALFEKIDVPLADAALRRLPVHFGGPVQVDRGFVLHRPLGNWQSTLAIDDEVGLTTSKDVLEAVARGEGPKDVLVSLGYAGWSAGQLEQEIAQNAWLTVAADPGVLFETPVEARLPAAMRLLGIDFSRLSDDVGHA